MNRLAVGSFAANRLVPFLRGEMFLAPLGAVLLAVAMTWPALLHPASRVPKDLGDPLLQAWSIAWGGHAVLHQRDGVFQANTFYPEPDSYAFTDTLLGYFPLALVGTGPEAALVRYNVLFVLVAALAFVGAYALARQLGARWYGAVVAGAAFAYAPWRLEQAGHLNILSTGGIALAVAALLRGHGYSFRSGYQPDKVRPGWTLFGWGVAAWQITLGFALGLPFAYFVAVLVIVAGIGWLVAGRPGLPRRLLLADAAGMVTFALVGFLMARPYLRIVERYEYAKRTEWEVNYYSPPVGGFFIAPPDSWLWGQPFAAARQTLRFVPEMTLLPGMLLIVLAVGGLAVSSWRVRQRLALFVATLISVILALGTTFFEGTWTYLPLYHSLPGWDGLRTPGRLVIYATLALALLAAGAITGFGEALGRRGGTNRRRLAVTGALLALPGVLVLIEGIGTTQHPTVPPMPAAMRGVQGPILVLPSDVSSDFLTTLWSTEGFPQMINGSSGFHPQMTGILRQQAAHFPDAPTVDFLQRAGIRTVIVLPHHAQGTPWQNAADKATEGLPLTRSVIDGAVVFRLNSPPAGPR